jgi:hypothetical protein
MVRIHMTSTIRTISLLIISLITTIVGVTLLAEPVLAHAGALRLTDEPVTVPRWLLVSTGGGVIGASFLFTSMITDHEMIRSINGWHRSVFDRETIRVVEVKIVQGVSIILLGMIVLSGLFGPQNPTVNFAIIVVWAGWWGGYTMSVYLVGNTWPAVNPWRALATLLPQRSTRAYPRWLGAWPSIAGLLGLVWLEVISPVAQSPQLLALVVIAYSVVTLAGATVYGVDTWFSRADPIARVFRWYGRVAPLQRTESGIDIRPPSTALTRETYQRGTAVFVIALLWVTTYDGLISTPAWATVVRAIVERGIPALAVYAGAMIGGFVVFLSVYRTAARLVRRTGQTYVASHVIEERFVLSLLPIAAGYHLAHYLGYFLSLSPTLAAVLVHPFGGLANPLQLVLPDWFGTLPLLFILLGHLFAVWVAHATAFDLFAGRLQPIRSQYPLIASMILYTATSMWIVIQPYTQPPFV